MRSRNSGLSWEERYHGLKDHYNTFRDITDNVVEGQELCDWGHAYVCCDETGCDRKFCENIHRELCSIRRFCLAFEYRNR